MANTQAALVKMYLILVEGSSDKAFLDALILHHAIPDFQVIAPIDVGPRLGGASAFKQVLESLPIRDGFSDIAGILIVSDNDDDGTVPPLVETGMAV